MPDSDKLSGIFLINYNISKYRHLPDKSYGYTVGTVIFLSQYFGTGSEIIGSSHIGEEEVQIGFHRIILYTGEVAPGSAIITSGYSFRTFGDRGCFVHTFYKRIPFGAESIVHKNQYCE